MPNHDWWLYDTGGYMMLTGWDNATVNIHMEILKIQGLATLIRKIM